MPELPEVETVRRGLAPHLEGARLMRVDARRPDLRIPFPPDFRQALTGRRIERLERRAKYLVARCEGDLALIMHLGMSGRFSVIQNGQIEAPGAFVHEGTMAQADGNGPHDHVVFETDAGTRIVYSDHRRFGLMTLSPSETLDAHPLMAVLGVEPIGDDFTPDHLLAKLEGRHTPIKSALLDQKVVAGLGNIYVCEALYEARISPRRSAYTIGKARAERLVPAIKGVLARAIEAGGSTLRDYAGADGALGYFQHSFKVYGREGEPCPDRDCGTVHRIVQANRSTFFCPKCQR